MKTGYVNAAAALLVACGWAAAQAPLPISDVSDPRTAPAQAAAYQPGEETLTTPPTPLSGPAPARTLTPVAAYPSYPTGPAVLPAGNIVNGIGRPSQMIYGSADFLLWRINNGHVPQVTAQPPVGVITVTEQEFNTTVNPDGSTTRTNANNNTTGFFPFSLQNMPALPDVSSVNLGEHPGARYTLGAWLSQDQSFGLEGSFFYLTPRSSTLVSNNTNANNQILFTTPFSNSEFTVTPGTGGAPATRTLTSTIPIFFVRQLDSTLAATVKNSLWGADFNARSTWFTFGSMTFGGLLGYRQLQFTEDLDVAGQFNLFRPTTVASQGGPNGDASGSSLPSSIAVSTLDHASTRNYFYGGQVGLEAEAFGNGFFLNLRTKVAMGDMHQVVIINGSTTTTTTATTLAPAGTTTVPNGLLFNALNNGRISRERIAFIPDLNLKAGYQFFPWMRGYVGYDVMNISNVVRPGDVSTPLTTTSSIQAASTTTSNSVTQPSFTFRDSSLWTQGINFGLELSY